MRSKNQFTLYLYSFLIVLTSSALNGCMSSLVTDSIKRDASRGSGWIGGSGIVIYDVEPDHFSVKYEPMKSDHSRANVPQEAIIYALTEFAGIPREEQYLDRIAEAAKKALFQYGYVDIRYKNDRECRMIQLSYHKDSKHLEVTHNTMVLPTNVNAIDLSKADVQIK